MQKLSDEWLKPDLRLPTGAVLLLEGATHARLWAEVGPGWCVNHWQVAGVLHSTQLDRPACDTVAAEKPKENSRLENILSHLMSLLFCKLII